MVFVLNKQALCLRGFILMPRERADLGSSKNGDRDFQNSPPFE